jgi:hypothetical protein
MLSKRRRVKPKETKEQIGDRKLIFWIVEHNMSRENIITELQALKEKGSISAQQVSDAIKRLKTPEFINKLDKERKKIEARKPKQRR